MTKTKRQLSAEAIERLMANEPAGILDKWSDGGEMSEVGKSQDSEIDSEIDTREQLERDIDIWLDRWIAWSIPKDKLWLEIFRWLDRQAAITERECVDTRVNFAERIRLYQRGYDDGRHARGAASFPQHHEDDSREKLEADVWAGCEHLTTAEREDVLVNVPWAKLLGWLDRAADIREREFVQQYCAECETAVLRDRLDNLAAERGKKAGLLETAFRRCKELEAENEALLAAHADDVERLDAMGEGELQKQVDELKEELIAEREAVEACKGCKLTDELRAEIAKRDKGIKRLKARRDELQAELEKQTADYADVIAAQIKQLKDASERNGELRTALDIAGAKLEGKPDCVPCDRTTLLTEVESLTAERDEWKEKALHCEHRLNMELACSDKSIIEALESANRELAAESARLKAERDYWRQEVQYCMDAAYPPSHAPERPYNPGVMGYPDRDGCTTPSTMVSAVIDGLRDEKADEWMGVLKQLKETEAERERYRKLSSDLLDAAHAMQLIADRGLA